MRKNMLGLALGTVAVAAGAAQAAPIGTAFTYQGFLEKPAGTPLTDTCDFRLGLWDAAGGGSQKGASPQTVNGVVVDTGYFLIQTVDFGAGAIDGTARWLEIEIKCTGDGAFQLQTPRVALTPTPHALALPAFWTLQPPPNAVDDFGPNIIGGAPVNQVAAGAISVTISGGGGEHIGGAPGPYPNSVFDDLGTIGGGMSNRTGNDDGDTTASCCSTVGGGLGNTAFGGGSTVNGGFNNVASAGSGTVGGGQDNRAGGVCSNNPTKPCTKPEDCLASGFCLGGNYATVGGGSSNVASSLGATVCGGVGNQALTDYDTVAGGNANSAVGGGVTVAGGMNNSASGSGATVGGGESNTASSDLSTVGGGNTNTAGGYASTVGGGDENVASGDYSAVPGGFRNTAGGEVSFAAGTQAKVRTPAQVGGGDTDGDEGTFVWADHQFVDFTSTGPNQFLIRAAGGVGLGTNAPEASLHVHKGSAGSVTSDANSIAVLESSTHGYLTLLTPDVDGNHTERGILFGDQSNNHSGAIIYNPQFGNGTSNSMQFRTEGGVTRMTIDSSGRIGIGVGGDTTPLTKPLEVGTDTTNGNGAHLTAGGMWTNGSDRNSKQSFESIDAREILRKVSELPVTRWQYKGEAEQVRHIGPVAQDFYAAFGTGNNERYIGTIDADGVALAAIQGLYEIVQEKDCEIEDLREQKDQQIEELRAQIAELKALVIARAGQKADQP